MPDTFRDFIEKLRQTVDIVEVVGETVELRRAGSRFKGLCPFHNEKTPSFTVSSDRQSFYCFGCNKHGDVISFVQETENLEFRDAIEKLARRVGLEVPTFRPSEDDKERRFREALYSINEMAREFFRKTLRAPGPGGAARDYLDKRGLDEEVRQRFEIGFAPDSWDALKSEGRRRGFSEEAMLAAGLLIRNEEKKSVYDRFRGRIIFPICDPLGRPIALAGRVFGAESERSDGAKYINSPETPLYRKSETLYAFHLSRDAIRKQGRVVLLEGYTDVIAMHRAGFENAVATCGTALTQEQARRLKRICDEIVFLYDDDDAGRHAMLRGAEILLREGFRVRCAALAAGADPDSYLREHGVDALRARLDESRNWIDYFIHLSREEFDLSTVEGQTAAVDRIGPLIRAAENAIEADEATLRLAEALGRAAEVVRAHLRLEGRSARQNVPTSPRTDDRAAPEDPLARERGPHPAERALLRILIDWPEKSASLSRLDLDWIEYPLARTWIQRAMRSPGDQGGLERLLELAENDDERRFLRRTVMVDEEITNVDSTLENAVQRLRQRHARSRARRLARSLDADPNSLEDIEDARQRMDQIRQAWADADAARRRMTERKPLW